MMQSHQGLQFRLLVVLLCGRRVVVGRCQKTGGRQVQTGLGVVVSRTTRRRVVVVVAGVVAVVILVGSKIPSTQRRYLATWV